MLLIGCRIDAGLAYSSGVVVRERDGDTRILKYNDVAATLKNGKVADVKVE
jgi:hypothetical protein